MSWNQGVCILNSGQLNSHTLKWLIILKIKLILQNLPEFKVIQINKSIDLDFMKNVMS